MDEVSDPELEHDWIAEHPLNVVVTEEPEPSFLLNSSGCDNAETTLPSSREHHLYCVGPPGDPTESTPRLNLQPN